MRTRYRIERRTALKGGAGFALAAMTGMRASRH